MENRLIALLEEMCTQGKFISYQESFMDGKVAVAVHF